jgi:hypothetical protein
MAWAGCEGSRDFVAGLGERSLSIRVVTVVDMRMRPDNRRPDGMFSYVSKEGRIP